MRQIDGILDGIISAYQEASGYRVPRRRWGTADEDLWIVGGDFNATPDSAEIASVTRSGFVDGNKDKTIFDADPGSPLHNQVGTKWSIRDLNLPPVVVDYIFCGIERTSFRTSEVKVQNSVRPYRPEFRNSDFQSDHAVLCACFELPD
jgi:endonuclease/exonuclease/phosphatase family metal-dependent hydrolase